MFAMYPQVQRISENAIVAIVDKKSIKLLKRPEEFMTCIYCLRHKDRRHRQVAQARKS